MEEKERFELKVKNDDEIRDQVLEIYRRTKDRIQQIQKSTIIKETKEKEHQKQIISFK